MYCLDLALTRKSRIGSWKQVSHSILFWNNQQKHPDLKPRFYTVHCTSLGNHFCASVIQLWLFYFILAATKVQQVSYQNHDTILFKPTFAQAFQRRAPRYHWPIWSAMLYYRRISFFLFLVAKKPRSRLIVSVSQRWAKFSFVCITMVDWIDRGPLQVSAIKRHFDQTKPQKLIEISSSQAPD